MKPNGTARKTILALATFAAGALGCGSSYDSAYYDPYVYYSYYPADLYYSSYYWADPYYYSYQDYGTPSADGGTAASGDGVSPTDGGAPSSLTGVGDVLRALARGESVCGDKVTVTAKTAESPCPTAGAETVRGGAVIVFTGCALPNGGSIEGSVDVDTTRTASEPTCSATTTITIAHTTTITNLSYTGPSGRRIVIPNQTASGTTTFANGQSPTSAAASINGRLQILEADGTLTSDRTYAGDVTVTPAADRGSYAIDGVLTLVDSDQSGTTVLTATDLTRSSSCCRPVGGRLAIVRSGSNAFSQHVWTFDEASCGVVRFDDDTVTLTTCL
jgi:hypothetical protein